MPFELVADPFDAAAAEALSKGLSYLDAVRRFERHLLEGALVQADGSKESVGEMLHVSRATIYRKYQRLARPVQRKEPSHDHMQKGRLNRARN